LRQRATGWSPAPSQQGSLFMKKNLTQINKKKTMQLVAWPYIDCE